MLVACFSNQLFRNMIKTYRYNANRNTVSHIIHGKSGLTVRYNFERGNIITKQKPELILKNKFAQDLLESSDLFKQGLVSLISTISEDSDAVAEETESKPKKQSNVEEVKGIRTSEEVIAYVNERFDKDTKTLATAMKHASKAGLIFPDFNSDI